MTDQEKLQAIRELHKHTWVQCGYKDYSGMCGEFHEAEEICKVEGFVCSYCEDQDEEINGRQIDKCRTIRILDGEL
jgi:hypothetical protein